MEIGFLLACLLVRYLKITAGKDVALLYDSVNEKIVCWAREQQKHFNDVGTASVTLQRGAGVRSKGCLILTSKCPEVICLGMAALTGVEKIIHFDGKTSKMYLPGNELRPGTDYPRPKEPDYTDNFHNWMDRCSKSLSDGKDLEFAKEFANVPAGGLPGMSAVIQNVIIDGEVEPVTTVPQRPPAAFGSLPHGIDAEMDSFWMSVARGLVGAIHTGGNLVHESMRRGHNIGCILVDANNRILAWGVNTITNNPTYHAETKCIWMFQHYNPGKLVPEKATLYTTLQSCLMCAATIKHACGDNPVRVVYADRDKVKGSVLTKEGGAKEIAISKILTDNDKGPLLAQHLLLARARLSRVKKAWNSKLIEQLEQLGKTRLPRDRSEVDKNFALLNKEINAHPALHKAQDSVKTWLLHEIKRPNLLFPSLSAMDKGFKGMVAGKSLEDVVEVIDNAKFGTEPEIDKIIKSKLESELSWLYERTKKMIELMGKVKKQSNELLKIERAANELPFTGGAPVLLRNPDVFHKLYQTPQIFRKTRKTSKEIEEYDLQPSKKIEDLNTEIQALDLLIQALRAAETYNEH